MFWIAKGACPLKAVQHKKCFGKHPYRSMLDCPGPLPGDAFQVHLAGQALPEGECSGLEQETVRG